MKKLFKRLSSARKMINDNGIYGLRAIFIFFDMLYCKRKLHCAYGEYFFYDFQNVKNSKRKNYLLRYHQRSRYHMVDRQPSFLVGKARQYTLFSDWVNREWLEVKHDNLKEIERFIKKYGKVIFKPSHGSQGKGIFSFSAEDIEGQLPQKFAEIVDDRYLCEQYIVQHNSIAELNPNSVNTIRIITLCNGEWVKIISAALRTNASNGVCDNMSTGGIGAGIDTNTGVIFTTGVDFNKKRYDCHPVTGKRFKGLEIPFWEEIKSMVKECALRAEVTAVIGWDIAVTENGPALIEANNRPAGRLAQIAIGEPMGEEVIDYINNNWPKYKEKILKSGKKV